MRIISAENYDDMSRKAANILAAQVALQPDCVLGLATGSTPLGLYAALISQYQAGLLDFSSVTSVNLDEYVGLGPNSDQSYRYFMQQSLFSKININLENTHVPNGLAEDVEAECKRYDDLIRAAGGIDMQLLGLGQNGHIGFNEPGDAFSTGTWCVELAESTIAANCRFFEKVEDVPRKALTMGTRAIMQAKHVLVVACGKGKAQAVQGMLRGPVTPRLPASILQLHPNATLVADKDALSLL